jgi:hypothetical protein
MSNNATIEIIYTILKNCEKYRSDANCKECTKNGTTQCKPKKCEWHYIPQEKGGRIIWGVDYLLGQILRQIDVPDERKHVSVGATEKWKELGFDEKDIWKYNYQDAVSCNTSATVVKYKGASKNGEEVSATENGGFTFREVFHDEHIVPINDVLEELFKIPKEKLTLEMISEYLDKIHVCRILKSEDRKIHPKYNRGCDLDYKRVYDEIYK